MRERPTVHYLSIRAAAARRRMERGDIVGELRRACRDLYGREKPDEAMVGVPAGYLRLLADVIEGKVKGTRGKKPAPIGSAEYWRRYFWASEVRRVRAVVDRARRRGWHIKGDRFLIALERVSARSGIPEGTLKDWHQEIWGNRRTSG